MKPHSSRVPGKNFRILHGKPLFGWVLDELLELSLVAQVVISTDAEAKLTAAGLTAGDRVVIRTRCAELCELSGATITRAWRTYLDACDEGFDSLLTVNRYQTRFYQADGSPIDHDPDNLIPTRDLEPWYEENSCLYIFSQESSRLTDGRIGRRPKLFETPPLESVDIDEPKDCELVDRTSQVAIERPQEMLCA